MAAPNEICPGRDRKRTASPSNATLDQGISLHRLGSFGANDTTTEDGGDTIITRWDNEDDPANPHNWSSWTVNSNAALIAILSFLMPLASSICAPGVPEIMKEFNNSSPELAAFVVSVYVLGFAFGPLLFAPLSEIYGRLIIYHLCNIGFIFVIGCALAPSLGALIAFRFLSGTFGACPITNGGASIADMIRPERRGAYMGLVSIGPLLGPIIGPVSESFLSAAKGWRWTFWLIAMLGGFAAVLMALFARETYAPVIMRKQKTGKPWPTSKMNDVPISAVGHLKKGFVRPLKLLVFSPISTICALYLAIVYGYLYLMFSSITEVFEDNYGFASNLVGLVFLGLGLGSIIGIGVTTSTSDRHIRTLKARCQQVKPESRLRLVPVGGLLLPSGLFLYGWTCQYHVFWIVPIIGMVIIGAGSMIIFMSVVLYLIDSFALYEASALAANTFIRSIGGALLPLVGLKLFNSLGMGWGNSLLGFLAAALIPVPYLLLRYGEYLRQRFEVETL